MSHVFLELVHDDRLHEEGDFGKVSTHAASIQGNRKDSDQALTQIGSSSFSDISSSSDFLLLAHLPDGSETKAENVKSSFPSKEVSLSPSACLQTQSSVFQKAPDEVALLPSLLSAPKTTASRDEVTQGGTKTSNVRHVTKLYPFNPDRYPSVARKQARQVSLSSGIRITLS